MQICVEEDIPGAGEDGWVEERGSTTLFSQDRDEWQEPASQPASRQKGWLRSQFVWRLIEQGFGNMTFDPRVSRVCHLPGGQCKTLIENTNQVSSL